MSKMLSHADGTLTTAQIRVRCFDATWPDFPIAPAYSLVPFLNRPFVHHMADVLVERGFQVIEFVSDGDVAPLVKTLGQGERWGARFLFRSLTETGRTEVETEEVDCLSLAAHALPFSSESTAASQMIRVDSPAHFLDSQLSIMKDDFSPRLTVEKNLGDHIWVGRNVVIHPSVTLNGPILIGENSRISAGVHLGPCTVIGSHCLIDRNTTLIKSTVFPNVYLGEGLHVDRSIVSSNRIINVELGTNVLINDDLLLARFPW